MNLLTLRAELDTGNYSADSVIAASELNESSGGQTISAGWTLKVTPKTYGPHA